MKYSGGEIIFKYGKSMFTNKKNNVHCLNIDTLTKNNINIEFESIYQLDKSFVGRRLADISIQHLEKSLPNLLRYSDRNSMAFSVENRVPFLTIELARYALSLPDHYHVSALGQTKAILKSSAEYLVPESILQRKDKIGFASDEYNLIKSNYDDFLDLIRGAHDIEIINCKNAELIFIKHMQSKDNYDAIVWRLINFIIWHRVFIH
jgi:asparagine synthase (glutamine-hydrolysing)